MNLDNTLQFEFEFHSTQDSHTFKKAMKSLKNNENHNVIFYKI